MSVICVFYMLPKFQIRMDSQLVGWHSKIQKLGPENSQVWSGKFTTGVFHVMIQSKNSEIFFSRI